MPAYDPLDADTDPFRPPAISTLVGCLHCGQEYDSYRMEWRVETDSHGRPHGFWCCPIECCDGRGFGFDIFPVDRDYRDENGDKMWTDDDEETDDGPENGQIANDRSNGCSDSIAPEDDESEPF
jgi:hypothetical protein